MKTYFEKKGKKIEVELDENTGKCILTIEGNSIETTPCNVKNTWCFFVKGKKFLKDIFNFNEDSVYMSDKSAEKFYEIQKQIMENNKLKFFKNSSVVIPFHREGENGFVLTGSLYFTNDEKSEYTDIAYLVDNLIKNEDLKWCLDKNRHKDISVISKRVATYILNIMDKENLEGVKPIRYKDCYGEYISKIVFTNFEIFEKYLFEAVKDDINKLKENEMKRKEHETLCFKQAKETGKNVKIYSYSVPCNSKNEECDIDNIIVYATPEGTIKKERIHCY